MARKATLFRMDSCGQAVLQTLSVVRTILRKITIMADHTTTLISSPVAAVITVVTAG